MNNLSLYNITDKFVELMDKAEEGSITEEEYNELGNELALKLQEKSCNIAGYIQEQEALIEGIDLQIKRLQEYKKTTQNKVDKFKGYVKDNMQRLNIDKISTELGTLTVVKSPLSVEITSEDDVPAEYKTEVITTKIDKTKIKEAYKRTGEIPAGTVIHNDNTYLKVK